MYADLVRKQENRNKFSILRNAVCGVVCTTDNHIEQEYYELTYIGRGHFNRQRSSWVFRNIFLETIKNFVVDKKGPYSDLGGLDHEGV